jgi:hypothetical protein
VPLPFAFPVGLLMGMTLAWVARAELARSEVPLVLGRPFLVALGLGAIVFAPVVGYFAALHGDWTYLYLVRWSGVPSAVDLVLVVLAGMQVPFGFVLATPWAIVKRGTRLLQVNAAVASAVVVAGAVFARRLAVSASFAQVHGGFGGAPLGKSPLGRGILLSWAALALAYAWSVHALRSPRRS